MQLYMQAGLPPLREHAGYVAWSCAMAGVGYQVRFIFRGDEDNEDRVQLISVRRTTISGIVQGCD